MDNLKHFTILNLSMVVLLAVSACAHQSQKLSSTEPKAAITIANEQPRVPDEYLVTLAPDADKGVITEYYGRYGIKDIYALGGETYLLVLLNDPGPVSMVSLVDADDRIMAVQPNLVYWDNRSGSLIK